MPKIVFTYFAIKALGEGCRLLLAYGGEEFEDRRLSGEEWLAFKPSTPFGQLPVLEIDGKKYARYVAISRYLGRKYGLAGADLEEDLIIDQNVNFVHDIRATAASVHYEADEKIKQKKHEEFSKNVYPVMLKKLDEIVRANNGHLAVGKLTWGDFVLAGQVDYLKQLMQLPNLDQQYPSLKQVVDNVYSLPQLSKYLAQAPQSE